ncbi:Protoporphyrinogen IX oxidase, menaquinone-dependent (flavodoxin domain) [Arcanobacterium phocae]|uniref:Protoporphyrinogen IX oxidase, menaquinone-dependent (Flavodoxin domain) n=1 Tax=Arcanobacterium phocae TaxID=131112 RepID=A0A1H2LH48_9ACTO|nr:flavodoxin domain-containing protein [Arcanobacterium phocae]SDU80055.1 Protoporphyrinogen IX oxidase, menaquinone-dependent (flavodoxin domain) [Arcanobacterium phocae]
MKRTIVIYSTVTGFARTYAQWIAEDLDADLYQIEELIPLIKQGQIKLASYDLIVYGAGVRMGVIRKFSKFRKLIKQAGIATSKKTIVWANGGTPQHPDRDYRSASRTFNRVELARGDYAYFYLEGGVRYEGLNPIEKGLLKTFAKRIQKYRSRGEWAVAVADHIAEGYDHTDRTAIAPLVARGREILNTSR